MDVAGYLLGLGADGIFLERDMVTQTILSALLFPMALSTQRVSLPLNRSIAFLLLTYSCTSYATGWAQLLQLLVFGALEAALAVWL